MIHWKHVTEPVTCSKIIIKMNMINAVIDDRTTNKQRAEATSEVCLQIHKTDKSYNQFVS